MKVMDYSSPLISDGLPTGHLPVADSSGFVVGASVTIRSDTITFPVSAQVLAIPDSSHIIVRAGAVGYSPTDMSAFLVSEHAVVHQASQYIDQVYSIGGNTKKQYRFSFLFSGAPTPPVAPGDGFPLNGLLGFRLSIVCQDSTAAFAQTGTLEAFQYDESLSLWIPTPNLDIEIPPDSMGRNACGFPGVQVPVPSGRLAYIPFNTAATQGDLLLVVTGVPV